MQVKSIAKSFTKKFLLNREYEMIAEDFITNESNVELIYKDNSTNEIVFIPIRITKYKEFLFKEEKEEYLRRRKIVCTMKWFLTKHNLLNNEVRVDLVEISIDKQKASLRYSMKVIG